MSSPQIQALLEELLAATRQNQQLLEQIAIELGAPAAQPGSVDVWNQPAGPVDVFNTDPGITPEVVQLVAKNKHIAAIKAYREATGAGLAEAKDAVDRYRTGLR